MQIVVVSIFVNPTQFGPSEDFARYPRDLGADVAACDSVGADVAFAPAASAIYPPGEETRVRPGQLASPLCGQFRAGHFDGVATVVAKLLILVGPSVAIFGRKDFQQLRVVSRLVSDLLLPVQVVGFPTVREPDGLARSSRNRFLSPDARERARRIPVGLSLAAWAFAKGERVAGRLRTLVYDAVVPVATSIDYVEVADPDSLRVLAAHEHTDERALVALALRIGPTRLIDNLVLGEDASPIAPEAESAIISHDGVPGD